MCICGGRAPTVYRISINLTCHVYAAQILSGFAFIPQTDMARSSCLGSDVDESSQNRNHYSFQSMGFSVRACHMSYVICQLNNMD